MIEQIKNKISTLVENTKRGLLMGREALKNDFAEHFQDGGKRKDYLFNNKYWDDTTFLMKYPMDLTSCSYTFITSKITHIDVPIILNGFVIDEYDGLKYPADIIAVFGGARELETIEEIRINEGDQQIYSNVFSNCVSLKNINKIVGTISGDGLDFTQTQVTPETMLVIITALGFGNWYSSIYFSAAQWNALNEAYPAPDGCWEWQDYVQQHKCFNI